MAQRSIFSILLRINGQNNTSPAFQQAQSDAKRAAAQITKNLNTLGNSMKSVGKGMTAAITLPMAGIVGSSVKTAMSFEQQMQKVAAISGAAGEDLQNLTDKAKEMGIKTKFSATESAQAFEYMAMAGWKTTDMMNGIEGIMNLASASGEDLATTSDIVTDALTAFGMKASESGRFADILASASSNSNTNVAMMGETFKYVAPVMGALGMKAEDTAIAIGLMANAGIKSSQAGTSLRTAMTNMSKPTKQMQKAMDKLGLSMTDSEGKTKDLKTLMTDLRYSFANLTETEKVNYAATIFGKNAYAGMLAIINSSEQDFNKLTSAVYSSSDGIGDAAEMSKTMLDSLSGQITILKSAWEGIQLKIAESVMPTIKQLVSFMQDLANKINEMNPKTLDMIVKIGLVVAAIGPLLWMCGSLITSTIAVGKGFKLVWDAVKGLRAGFLLLKSAMAAAGATSAIFSPWTYIIGAIIAAVIALVVICVKNWDKIKESWGKMCNWMKEQWGKFTDWIKPGVDKVKGYFNGLYKKWGIEKEMNVIGETLKQFKWNDYLCPQGQFKILDAIAKNLSGGTGLVDMAKQLGEKIWGGLTEFFDNVKTGFDFLLAPVKEFIDNIVVGWDYLTLRIKMGVETIKINIEEGVKQITKVIIAIAKPFIEVGKWIVDSIKHALHIVKMLFLSVVAVVWNTGKVIGEKFVTPIINTINNIKNIIKKAVSSIVDIALKTIQKKITAIVKVVKSITKKIQTVLKTITTFVRTLINNIKDAFTTGFNFIKGKIVDGLLGAVSKVYNKIKSFYGKIIEFIRTVMSIVDNFKKGFQTIMEKIVEVFMGIYNQYNAFVEKFRSFISDVKKDLTDFINAIINGINHLTSGLNKLKITIKGVEELGIPDINWGFNIAQIPNLPSLSIGTSEVLKDGLAVIHKGEAVVPAQVNPWRNDIKVLNRDTQRQVVEIVLRDERSDQNININLDGRVLANALNKRTRVDYLVRG